MTHVEYLLSYGMTGEFGRFRAAAGPPLRRGDRVVVRSRRGLEVARVLRDAAPGHAHFLPNTTVGQILRPLSPEDERQDAASRARAQELFARGRALAEELGLPLEVVDVEVLLDGEHAVLHQLRWAECDLRPFVSTLSRESGLHVALEDLAGEAPAGEAEEEHAGCGRPDCDHAAGGGCATCGSGGGCGSCGAGPQDVRAHFAGLREQMEQRRTSLL